MGALNGQQTSRALGGVMIIDENGQWVGDPTGLIGPTGATGPQGYTGPTGPTGAPGPQGEQGIAGLNGQDGIDGQDGADGVDGEDGKDFDPADLEKGLATMGALTIPHIDPNKSFGIAVSPAFYNNEFAIGFGAAGRIDGTWQIGGSIATDFDNDNVAGSRNSNRPWHTCRVSAR